MKRMVFKKKGDNFWDKIPRPFFVMAPMANVTDYAFRQMFAKYGKPDVTWTEFVSADGLVSEGKKRLMIDLKYSNKERPIVAQLFTGHVDVMERAAKMVLDLGFDGLDINMGCPDRAVEKQGGGASLIKNSKLAIEILNSARKGVCHSIPVSVKTRIGYNKFDPEWLGTLLSAHLPALTIHLRTRKEMSLVSAHWELVPEIVNLRNKISPGTVLIFNGDVSSVLQGAQLLAKYGGDGVMVGRGIFGKPWFFSGVSNICKNFVKLQNTKNELPGLETHARYETPKEKLKILLEHTKLFAKTFKDHKNFDVMKKHFKAYVSGWDGAKELRVRLMGAHDYSEVAKIIKGYLKRLH